MVNWGGLAAFKEKIFEHMLPKQNLLLEIGGNSQIWIQTPYRLCVLVQHRTLCTLRVASEFCFLLPISQAFWEEFLSQTNISLKALWVVYGDNDSHQPHRSPKFESNYVRSTKIRCVKCRGYACGAHGIKVAQAEKDHEKRQETYNEGEATCKKGKEKKPSVGVHSPTKHTRTQK